MRSTRRPSTGWRERGAAAVELAIIMPLLMLFIGGIIDFGRYFLIEIQLTNAAREGARVAVIGYALGDITSRSGDAAQQVTDLDIDVTECAGAGTQATVVASAPFKWMILYGLPAPTATSTAVMTCEA